ncbi:hypothetical protein [Sulfitobacter sp. 1A12157]|uniref:hypothetical protein n=1 Tax=Sulfitobacter sp. 1A12157 TaxID=3368594 RepID=UPI00374649F6
MEEFEALALAAAARKRKAQDLGLPDNPGGVSANPAAVAEFQGKATSAFDGAMQGGTFGFGDEMAGVRSAIFGSTVDDQGNMARDMSGTMGERYTSERDRVRAQNEASQSANPLQYGAGEIAGGSVPALTGASLATGNGLLNTAVRSGILGALGGGAQGAGHADGRDLAPSIGKGAAMGGIAGVAAPIVVKGGAAVKNAVKDPMTGVIDTMTGNANQGKANRVIAEMLRASKKNPDEVGEAVMRAAQEGQSQYRMMDAVGVPGQRQASGLARAGGDSGAEIAEFLRKRQAGQGERVAEFVDEGFGLNGTTAAKEAGRLTEARSASANSAYDAARGNAAPVDVRGALGVIDSRIGGMQGSNVAGDAIDGKLAGYRKRLAADPAPDGETARELSDFDRVLGVKQSIQDDIGAAVRAGRNNEARELGKLASELDGALEASSDMYRAANDGFRDASRVIDAVDQGADMARPARRSSDTVSQFGSMTPPQQQAARVGYGDSLLSKIEANTAPTANKAKILQSPKRDAEAQAMAVDPSLYGRRIGRENDMWEVQNRALGGSRTADNLQDIGGTSEAASGLMGAGRSALNFQFGDAVAKVGGVLGPAAKGQNDATRQLIARALMSDDPVKALEPALRQDMSSQSKRRLIEALLRQPMREGGEAALGQ